MREEGAQELGTKVEVKNMNSFSAMQRAIDFEIDRQVRLFPRSNIMLSPVPICILVCLLALCVFICLEAYRAREILRCPGDPSQGGQGPGHRPRDAAF